MCGKILYVVICVKKTTIYALLQMVFGSGERYWWGRQAQEEDFPLSTCLLLLNFKSVIESSAKNKC